MSAILDVRNLAKAYGKNRVLENVTFHMDRGMVIGIEGENGAGKSTLLKILVGLLKPDKGSISINGSFGFCPQETLLFENLTVAENFYYFAGAYGLHKYPDWMARKYELLARFRFSRYEQTLVSKLSGGTRQKLNLALAILHSPDVLVLDEPYAAFDWETYLHFWEYVKEVRKEGRNVLIVSHLIYDPSQIDRRYTLREGVLECV